ncbi:hypothetical protein C5167_049389 [Papaver somniferum]|uniref:Uncharacterized protein n=1 Tax=Papaver somniferum TaxID=3469 RepID=A0A4Y7KNJ8_PAPSO|nr:uncharacterized protein LOC113301678 [Papaver somniferum]RZC73910.1 hypothetical protein C5167_049389 [Papaver somniferum]
MAISLSSLLSSSSHLQIPNSPFTFNTPNLLRYLQRIRTFRSSKIKVFAMSNSQNLTTFSPKLAHTNDDNTSASHLKPLKIFHSLFLQFAASSILFVCLSARAADIRNTPLLPPTSSHTLNEDEDRINGKSDAMENIEVEDKELKAKFDSWKSKTFALTVPLRIVALRGSIPPLWIKDFLQSQGRRLKLSTEFRGSLDDVFNDLSTSFSKSKLGAKSAMAADIVSVGHSWLSLGISKGMIESMQDVEGQDWFKGLSNKWKVYLRRNSDGQLNVDGRIWAAPYRWGSMVIVYKKNKFRKHNIAPIEDWKDLWRPELAGKISMVDSPREVIGAVLKYMGASYNTLDFNSQVPGGRDAVLQNLLSLQKQVRLFDSVHYLKAFGVGDVWVAVGWSSDVLPAAKRMSNVAVVVPKSGASLWADLWAIPAASKFASERIGGRIRGPSPLIHQWMEFCLQAARALPFQQEVIPGSSPVALEQNSPIDGFQDTKNGKLKLDTNLISGVPPSEILAKCEFLEPLTDTTLTDYQVLINSMQRKPSHSMMDNLQCSILSIVQSFWLKPSLREP